MTLEWWQALILGAVQGLTEFLPVSSSGHLGLAPALLGWPDDPGLVFDALVHGGTAGALVVVFRRELQAMAQGLAGRRDHDARLARRLAGLVVVGTVPLVVVGLTLRGAVEAAFVDAPAAATGLLATAVILLAGERWRSRRAAQAPRPSFDDADTNTPVGSDHAMGDWAVANGPHDGPRHRDTHKEPAGSAAIAVGVDADDPRGSTLDRLTPLAALLIGVGQAVAVLPGISRSGTTIMTGVITGLTREAATRFAFLLALPALGGAVVLSALEMVTEGTGTVGWVGLAGAVAVAFVTALIAIRWLLRLVARAPLSGFAVYCAAAGVAGWLSIVLLAGGI